MHCFQDVQAAPEYTLNYEQGRSLGTDTKTRTNIQFLNGILQRNECFGH